MGGIEFSGREKNNEGVSYMDLVQHPAESVQLGGALTFVMIFYLAPDYFCDAACAAASGGTRNERKYNRLFSFAKYEGSDTADRHDHPISVYQQGSANELTILWGKCCGSANYTARYKT